MKHHLTTNGTSCLECVVDRRLKVVQVAYGDQRLVVHSADELWQVMLDPTSYFTHDAEHDVQPTRLGPLVFDHNAPPAKRLAPRSRKLGYVSAETLAELIPGAIES